ncbi:Mating-type M-specific polypeptide Mc [Trametes pubescens]|uniref:Mating-type M-specific polypeptide Mc n=1 Tax=Trametes pubescens TaxID=154538 RepID=A0A1M2VYR7_TRAPU|nr:Mating-type M-specific polypeptide Mc [Trametes pubescens]
MPPTRTQRKSRKTPAPHQAPEPIDTPDGATPAEEDGEKIARPSNAWILYRTARAAELKDEKARKKEPPLKQSQISQIVGQMWRAEAPEVRKAYEKEAARLAAKHAEMYPDYKYQPMNKEQKLAWREEQAKKKKLLQDAKKAAKESARKASPRASGSRKSSAEVAPVQAPAQVAAPRRASTRIATRAQSSASSVPVSIPSRPRPREPMSRGAGASPPLDSDAESTLSSTPTLSFDGETLLRLPYPLQATMPDFAPPSVSDFGQVIAPDFPQAADVCYFSPDFLQQGPSTQVPAMGTDGAWSSSLSTPRDSPPSYTEGDQFPGSGMASASSELNMRSQWRAGPPIAFNDPQRPFPAHLPPAGSVETMDIQDVLRALECAPSIGAWAASPPTNVDFHLAHLLGSPRSATLYPNGGGENALAQAMNLEEVQDVMDSSFSAQMDESAFDAAMDAVPRSFEDNVQFQVAFPQTASHVMMDPEEFYRTQAAEAALLYPELALNLGHDVVSPPYPLMAPDEPITGDMGLSWHNEFGDFFSGVPMEPTHDAAGSSGSAPSPSGPPTPTQHDAFYGAPLLLSPSVDYSPFAPSLAHSPSAPTPTSTPTAETTEFASPPVDNTPATQRYVPPGGAGQASRRRVGGRFARPPVQPGQAQGSGSGSSTT